MFAREAALSENGGIPISERSVVSGALEPNVMVSPERKRPYDMDHSETSLVNFSDGELDDQPLHTSTSTNTPKKTKISISDDCTNDVPAPIPDLPRVSEDMVSFVFNFFSCLFIFICTIIHHLISFHLKLFHYEMFNMLRTVSLLMSLYDPSLCCLVLKKFITPTYFFLCHTPASLSHSSNTLLFLS